MSPFWQGLLVAGLCSGAIVFGVGILCALYIQYRWPVTPSLAYRPEEEELPPPTLPTHVQNWYYVPTVRKNSDGTYRVERVLDTGYGQTWGIDNQWTSDYRKARHLSSAEVMELFLGMRFTQPELTRTNTVLTDVHNSPLLTHKSTT